MDGVRVNDCLDGARGDLSVSADAMRWSPDRGTGGPRDGGLRDGGLRDGERASDVSTARRSWLVRWMRPFAAVAADVRADLRLFRRSRPRGSAVRG
jgi:hypothetical protein